MKSIDDFLAVVGTSHPAVADMVRSGEVLDTNIYNNYLYWADNVYSPDGWFLIGDAARSVDPLYSTGLSMSVVQIEQVGAIISQELQSSATADQIQSLEKLWMTVVDLQQDEITDQYTCMHDAFQGCMRRYWNVCTWFNGLLPIWYNGLLHSFEAAPVLQRLFESGRPSNKTARRLIANVARRLPENLTQAEFDKTADFDWLVNPRFDCLTEEVPQQFGRLLHKRAIYRWTLLRQFGFRCGLLQLPSIALELALSKALPVYVRWAAPGVFAPSRASRSIQKAQRSVAQ
jgi:hypothetical protein